MRALALAAPGCLATAALGGPLKRQAVSYPTYAPCQPNFQSAPTHIVQSNVSALALGLADSGAPVEQVGNQVVPKVNATAWAFTPSIGVGQGQVQGIVLYVNPPAASTGWVFNYWADGQMRVSLQPPSTTPTLWQVSCEQCTDPTEAPYAPGIGVGRSCSLVGNGTTTSYLGTKWDFVVANP